MYCENQFPDENNPGCARFCLRIQPARAGAGSGASFCRRHQHRGAQTARDLFKNFPYNWSAWNLSPGIYYDQPVYRALGLSTGLNYLRFARVEEEGYFYTWSSTKISYDMLEVPLLLTLDLCPKTHCWNFRALAGYSMGVIVAAQGFGGANWFENDKKYKISAKRLSSYHFVNAGFEARYRSRGGLTGSIGFQGRWGWREESEYEQYDVSDVCLVFKAGFMKSKKRAVK